MSCWHQVGPWPACLTHTPWASTHEYFVSVQTHFLKKCCKNLFSRVYFIPFHHQPNNFPFYFFIFPFLHISRKLHLSRVSSPKQKVPIGATGVSSCTVGKETCLCAGNTHDHSFRFVCLMVVITRFAKTRSLSECTVSRLLCSQDAEGSNFAIWSSKWTPCDINVEIKNKKKPFAQTGPRIISNLVLYSQICLFWMGQENVFKVWALQYESVQKWVGKVTKSAC